LNKIIKEQLQ